VTPPIRLFLDGVKVADGTPGEADQVPFAIDGLTVSWGRPTTVDQPEPTTCSFTLQASTLWADPDLFATTVKIGRAVVLDAGRVDDAVFLGYITDVAMVTADDDPTKILLTVTCDDLLADLNQRPSTTVARPVESVGTRFGNLLGQARLNTPYLVDSDLTGIPARRIIVDEPGSTMVTESLTNLATSVDGVLWSIGFYVEGDTSRLVPGLHLESPNLRAPLRRLAYVAPWVVIVDVSTAAGAFQLDPCVPDLAPIEWRQTMSDLVTGVSVTYYTADPTDSTRDVGTTITVVEPGAESPSRPWGVRRMTIDSDLTSAADATDAATRILARLSTPSWRLNNITVDPATAVVSDADMLKLITLRSRHGLPVTISPLPSWSPPSADLFSGYLEGGEISSIQGVWSTSLWLSAAQGYAGAAGRWIDIPDPRVASTWTYSTVAADGTYRWASGASVLTIAFIDSTGASLTAALSAIVAGDTVQIINGSVTWTAKVTLNTIGTDKVQLTVTGIQGTMPPVGTTALIAVSQAGQAAGPWRWQDIHPDITYADLVGVAGPI